MTKIRAHISRHALERYLERVKGVDIDGITRRLTAAGQVALDAGASGFTIDGMRFPITELGLITTAIPTDAVFRKQQKEPTYGRRTGKRGYHGGRKPPDHREDGRRHRLGRDRDEDLEP